MVKKATAPIFSSLIFFCMLFAFSSNAKAQTIYKSDAGYFASIESLYFRGGNIESAQLIGPAFGYRFNKKYDLSLHTEFLFSEFKFDGSENGNTSLLNLGLTLGRTTRFSERLMARSELSLYKSFNFRVEGFSEIPNPSLTSAQYATSLYATLPLFGTLSLLPNAGGFLGYGEYDPPVSDANLTQAFDGFVAGPKLGLGFLFAFSDAFHMTFAPTFRYHLTDNAPYEGEINLNIRFNF